jgi:DNA-binding response OmpR family regulator
LANKGKIVLRNDLMLKLWNSDEYIDENTLTVNVARLRTTLSDLGLGDLIKTRKGEGYIIE